MTQQYLVYRCWECVCEMYMFQLERFNYMTQQCLVYRCWQCVCEMYMFQLERLKYMTQQCLVYRCWKCVCVFPKVSEYVKRSQNISKGVWSCQRSLSFKYSLQDCLPKIRLHEIRINSHVSFTWMYCFQPLLLNSLGGTGELLSLPCRKKRNVKSQR